MISAESRPRLANGVRLREDRVRGGFNLLAPERVLRANASSAAILCLCDGTRTLGQIADTLSRAYDADRDQIERDAQTLLGELISQRMVEL